MKFKLVYVLLIPVIFLIFYLISKNANNVINIDRLEISLDDKDNKELILFSTSWCHNCKKIKPNWIKAREIIENKNYKNITVKEIICEGADARKCFIRDNGKNIQIEGVPTIIFRKIANDIEYKEYKQFGIIGNNSTRDIIKFRTS